MIDQLIRFWSFSDPNVLWVAVGSLLLGAVAGLIGAFTFLRRRSLIGDTLAHASLPGITTGFLLTYSKDPLVLVGGSIASCFLGWLSLECLVRYTRLKQDAALAIVLTTFFGLGLFQLSAIQKLPIASQAGLDKILFGQAASMTPDDLIVTGGLAIAVLIFVALFFERLKVVTFDRQFATSLGIPTLVMELLLSLTVVLAVVVGLRLVGVVLMAAVVLTPAAAARYWTNRLSVLLVLSALFGALSGLLGAQISYLEVRMPTGPWIVVSLTFIFALSLCFAPERGVFWIWLQARRSRRRITEENLLTSLYRWREANGAGSVAEHLLLRSRTVSLPRFERALRRLEKAGNITRTTDGIELTELGTRAAIELARRHRLWELYLTERANISPDHVHESADIVEHVITSDIETQLAEELGSPAADPHGKEIPK